MRILVISSAFPFPPRWGYATRVYHLARELASRHEVTLLSFAEAGDEHNTEELRSEFDVEVVVRNRGSRRISKRASQVASVFSRHGFHARWLYTPEMQTTIERICLERRFHVAQLESSLLSAFRFPDEVRLVLDEHNIEYEVFERMNKGERSLLRRSFYRLEQARFRRFEERSWREVAGCVVTSDREAEIVAAAAPETPTAVVPNGVDLEYFAPSVSPIEPRTLVFNGVLDYRPNLDAAYFMVDEILPLVRERYRDAKLTIVGRGADPAEVRRLERSGVTLTGEVPDVRPHLASAAVVVVPIRMGGGTRLKVVEGLAMGKAMVTSTLGCEGINVVDQRDLLIADSPEGFAASVVRLFEDPALGVRLGSAGRVLMEAEYSWASAGRKLETLLESVAAADGSSGASSRSEPRMRR